MNSQIQVFENQPIRTAWDNENEEWYFSIVDVIRVLTESKDPNAYWRKLKQRLKEEGNQTVTNCHALKMRAQDGKQRLTDVATTAQLLRLIQSLPSPKAEPFKMWLAEVGRERIDETIDPELTIDRALETYARLGYSPEWINQRLQTIRARKELTDEWKAHGVQKGREYDASGPFPHADLRMTRRALSSMFRDSSDCFSMMARICRKAVRPISSSGWAMEVSAGETRAAKS